MGSKHIAPVAKEDFSIQTFSQQATLHIPILASNTREKVILHYVPTLRSADTHLISKRVLDIAKKQARAYVSRMTGIALQCFKVTFQETDETFHVTMRDGRPCFQRHGKKTKKTKLKC